MAPPRNKPAAQPCHWILAGAAILLFLTWSLGFWSTEPEGDSKTLVFLSVGDYGVGTKDQAAVAAQMARTAKEHSAQFIISLGDNVYDYGVKSVGDPNLWKCFEDVYTQPALQRRWLMALGDHDHRGSVAAQVAFTRKSSKWYMPAPYYVETFPVGPKSAACTLDVIVTDSIPLEALIASDDPAERRFGTEYNLTESGRKVGKKELKWLKRTLAASQADWKIVIGHRPVLTCAVRPRFPAEAKFPDLIRPILEQFKVDAYISGHDHIGQHNEENGVAYYGNGVGGYGNHDAAPNNATIWSDGSYLGFALHKVTREQMVTEFIDKNGKILHTATISHGESPSAEDPHRLLRRL